MYIPDNTPRHSVYYDYQIYPFRTPPELNGEAKRYPVVIVGAGPIGLVTALELASYGTPVVVISAEVQVSHGSRAIVFTRRSMEILQQVGIAERMLEKAYPWRSGNSIYRGQRVFRLEAPYDEDDRFQPLNNLQQQYVEQYLVEQAQQNPLIELRWGSKVIGVTSLLDHAEVQIDTPEGEYSLSCDWLIAADGDHLRARDHDVAHPEFGNLEHPFDHLLGLFVDDVALFGILDHADQLMAILGFALKQVA